MSSDWATYMFFASQAIKEALAFTPQGSDNKEQLYLEGRTHGLNKQKTYSILQGSRKFAMELKIERESRFTETQIGPENEKLHMIFQLSQAARTFGHGNCLELSALAFWYLYRKRIRPIDFMWFTRDDYEHVWVVIGREEGDIAHLKNWGNNAVWCDPWGASKGLYFPVEYLVKGKKMLDQWGVYQNDLYYAIRQSGYGRLVLDPSLIEAGKPYSFFRAE